MLFGLFGWKVAGLYVASGLIIASAAGFVIGRLNMERYVEDFVWKVRPNAPGVEEQLTWSDRIERAWDSVKEIIEQMSNLIAYVFFHYLSPLFSCKRLQKNSWLK